MTPKEQYEARKAERKRIAEDMHMDFQHRKRTEESWMLDTFDRFVTAVERIADTMESANKK